MTLLLPVQSYENRRITVGPEDHRLAVDVPRQQAAARLRRDAEQGGVACDLDDVLLLELRHGNDSRKRLGRKWLGTILAQSVQQRTPILVPAQGHPTPRNESPLIAGRVL